MKILHISTYFNKGGAAIAAKRLHEGLLQIGASSTFYSYYKPNIPVTVENVIWHPFPNKLKSAKIILETKFKYLKYPYHKKSGQFSTNYLPSFSLPEKIIKKYDIINFHWINAGFINIKELKKMKGKKIFLTLHDMWAFTGGCHYNEGCEKFTSICNDCPILNSKKYLDHSTLQFQLKKEVYSELDLEIVTPSKWLYDEAMKSVLFGNRKIHLIPYGLDTKIFTLKEKSKLREELNIEQGKFTILFNAANILEKRKGIDYLINSLKILSNMVDFQLILIGNVNNELKSELNNYKVYFIGSVSSEYLLAKYYTLSDLFVIPSRQDNLPNTMIEAIACGCPVVGFNIGGIPDAVIDGITGKLAKDGDIEDLTNKMLYFASLDSDQAELFRLSCRKYALENFNLQLQASKYMRIY